MSGGNFADLRARALSAVAMIVVAGAALWQGGLWFEELAVIAGGIMMWELSAMYLPAGRKAEAIVLGVLAACAVSVVAVFWLPLGWALILVPPALAAWRVEKDRLIVLVYGVLVLVAACGLAGFRDQLGAVWVLWLILVVIASDVAGYFAGRLIGGPKFWPAVSPKKTWSGTIAGWLGAALVGLGVMLWIGGPATLPVISAGVAFAAQLGDVAESAIKRRAGIKDSSNLIPGHGGLLDRFDALMGASLAMMLVGLVNQLPVIGG